jgi:hypothetical protein
MATPAAHIWTTPEWDALKKHAEDIKSLHLRDLMKVRTGESSDFLPRGLCLRVGVKLRALFTPQGSTPRCLPGC